MIVEFIGTPGAGKTTLLPTVIAHLAGRGVEARTVVDAARPYARRTLLGAAVDRLAPPSLRRPLLWQVFYRLSAVYRLPFCAKHPALTWQVLSSQRRRPISAADRRHVLYWYFHLVGYYEFLTARARPGEALILDEGFIHRVVQMNASDVETPNPAQIEAYVNRLPRPDLVIYPRAPWELCERRIYQRGLWERFRQKDAEEISRYVANAHRIVNLAVSHIRRMGWTVIELDNGGDDPRAASADLLGKLASLPRFTRETVGLRQAAPGGAA